MERALFYLRLFPGTEAEYDLRHANIWPELVTEIRESGLRNMSGFRRGTDVWYYVEAEPDKKAAFEVHGPKPKNQEWGRYFRDVIAEITGPDGGLIWYDEIFHAGGEPLPGPMQRSLIHITIDPERAADYDHIHAHPWPDMMAAIEVERLPQLHRLPARRQCRLLRRVLPRHRDGLGQDGRVRGHRSLGQGLRGHHHDHRGCPRQAHHRRRDLPPGLGQGLIMRVAVTGGSGFVGSHLVRALVARGDEVTSLDVAARSPLLDGVAGVRIMRCDVAVAGEVGAVLAEVRPELIFHTAGILSASAEDRPHAAYQVNATGTYNVLQAAELLGIGRIVFTSTMASYGPGVARTVDETTPQRPITMYGVTKVFGELLGEYFSGRSELDFRAIRLPAVMGPGRGPGGASAYGGLIVSEAARGRPFVVPVKRSTVMPLIYVKDVVNALISVSEADAGSDAPSHLRRERFLADRSGVGRGSRARRAHRRDRLPARRSHRCHRRELAATSRRLARRS